MAKFIQYFDIISGQEQEFERFAKETYIPGIAKTGLSKIVGGWNVVVGEGPSTIFEAISESPDDIYDLLEHDEFEKLNRLMQFLVTNYRSKILIPLGEGKYPQPVEKVVRFNHHFNLDHRDHAQASQYLFESHLPSLEKLGLNILGVWETQIGPEPNTVIETWATDIGTVMNALDSSTYCDGITTLKKNANGFGSRILTTMEIR